MLDNRLSDCWKKSRFGNRKPDSRKTFAIYSLSTRPLQGIGTKLLNCWISDRVHVRTVEAVVLPREAVRVLKRHQEAFRGREKLLVSKRALLEARRAL